MSTDEAAIYRLIDAIKAAEPHIAALKLQISRGDRTAYAAISSLLTTTNALFDVADDMLDAAKIAHHDSVELEKRDEPN
jgi:hypothetical protein